MFFRKRSQWCQNEGELGRIREEKNKEEIVNS